MILIGKNKLGNVFAIGHWDSHRTQRYFRASRRSAGPAAERRLASVRDARSGKENRRAEPIRKPHHTPLGRKQGLNCYGCSIIPRAHWKSPARQYLAECPPLARTIGHARPRRATQSIRAYSQLWSAVEEGFSDRS